MTVSRDLDYKIATELQGFPPFDWQVSDRLAREFSHGNLHHGSPCMVCGRERSLQDLECLPHYSTSGVASMFLLEWLDEHGHDVSAFTDERPMDVCLTLLRARGKEGELHG